MSDNETAFRYLPKEGESQTHVATLSGHAVQVYPLDPLDGQPGTKIHPRFKDAAILAGCQAFIEPPEYSKPARSAKASAKAESAALGEVA